MFITVFAAFWRNKVEYKIPRPQLDRAIRPFQRYVTRWIYADILKIEREARDELKLL